MKLGYSTCPNDTFIFYALAHRKIDLLGMDFDIDLKDVEVLNLDLSKEIRDVSKVSIAAMGFFGKTYRLLPGGGAIGKGCGPLLLSRKGYDFRRIGNAIIAVPGMMTTAHLLLGLYLNKRPSVRAVRFDRVMPMIRDGECDAGVVIHEGRFTYPDYGLECHADLGVWWEETTSLPLPLGGIAVHRNIPENDVRNLAFLIRNSLDYAVAHPAEPMDYIREYAKELDDSVIQSHIDLYVNNYSLDMGQEGREAIVHLLGRAKETGLIPEYPGDLFVE